MKKLPITPAKGPVLLIVMDGVGIAPPTEANAVHLAYTPTIDSFPTISSFYTQLKAHGTAVGMPSDEDMGNSEVGHNALGAGRVFDQGAALVSKAIQSGSLYKGKVWQALCNQVIQHNTTLHFIGLLSDGNVHSHITHLFDMLTHAHEQGVSKVRIHCLLDGRDVAERSALAYLAQLNSHLASINNLPNRDYKVASGGGRMVITMDRYNAEWAMVERGWKTHVLGEGVTFASAEEAIQAAYASDDSLIDQYIPPFVIQENGIPAGKMNDGDSVILFNFRGDRAIELSKAFEDKDFPYFDRKNIPNVHFAGMMEYDGDLHIPTHYLVDPPLIDSPLGVHLCQEGIKSFAISETQKYGHVTFFWNGNKSGYINKDLETYIEIKSDTIPFQKAPKMKAQEITDKTIELLKTGQYQFGRLNFPNGDMVGHTGIMDAVIVACEETDRCVKQLIDEVNKLNGITIVLADHGNADEMFVYKNGVKENKTSHTLNPVPFAIVDSQFNGHYVSANIQNPGLANVAATVCNLLGFEAPENYEPSLIKVIPQ